MHNQLEKYLSQIEKQLSTLPAEQRRNELREIRSHLKMMIEENIARGCDADEAVLKAIAQFGAAKKVGKDLMGARINNRLMWKRIALAALAAWAVLSIGNLPSILMVSAANSSGNIVSENIRISIWIMNIWGLALVLGCGWLTEVIAPRKAGFSLAVIVFFNFIMSVSNHSVISSIALHPAHNSLQIFKGAMLSLLILSTGVWIRRWQVERRQQQPQILAE